ncbi:hypothetical protein [Falsiroseomonas sp. E2-1-a20]|uniref:hypothetical protein n=1 Tax=Falsiroseomonas sp. E2-1-a20 TaxID=3239300 RepID=UPI003F385EB8
MTAEDIDRGLTPAEMAQLRAEFQRMGMTLAQETEAADTLVRMAGRLSGMECKMDRMLADTADMRATLTRIEARMAAAAEGGRWPRA